MHIDRGGSLKDWYLDALDNVFWNRCIERLRDPSIPAPERPNRDANFNPRRSRRNREQTGREQQENPRQDPPRVSPRRERGRRNRSPPREQPRNNPSPSPSRESERDFIPENVGRVMYDSLKIFGLGYAATLNEVSVNFKALARIYHPDQHKPERTGLYQASKQRNISKC